MLKEERVMEIKILHRQGQGIRAIARELGISRNTVRAYLRSQNKPVYPQRPSRGSKLDRYKPYIRERLAAADLNWILATVIEREIRAPGYQGSIRLLRYYMAELKPKVKPEPVVRFETDPGQQMQVDWGFFDAVKSRCLPLLQRWATVVRVMWSLSAMSGLKRSSAAMKMRLPTSRVCLKKFCMTICKRSF